MAIDRRTELASVSIGVANPVHVGAELLDVGLGQRALEGGHLDRLAVEEEGGGRILPQAANLALRHPLAELGWTLHQLEKIAGVPRRDVSLERARGGGPPPA